MKPTAFVLIGLLAVLCEGYFSSLYATSLLFDFGSTPLTSAEARVAPYAESSWTATSWNSIGANYNFSATQPGLVYSDGTPASGVTVDLAASTGNATWVNFTGNPIYSASGASGAYTSNAGTSRGSSGQPFYNAAPARDMIYAGASGTSTVLGFSVKGLSSGVYDVHLTGANVNSLNGTNSIAQAFWVVTSSSAPGVITLSSTLGTSQVASNTNYTTWAEGNNYVRFRVALSAGESLVILATGNTLYSGATAEQRAFLNSVEIVPVPNVPPPAGGKKMAVLLVSYWPPEGNGYVIHPQMIDELRTVLGPIQTCGVAAKSLDPQTLNNFNIVVLAYPPAEGTNTLAVRFQQDVQMWKDYVARGGGLLIFADENFYSSYKNLNFLLQPLGAAVLPEAVTDPATRFQQEDYFRFYFSTTRNLRSHPTTASVSEVCYPLGSNPQQGATLTMTTSPEWTPVVFGNATAYSAPITGTASGTYTASPPIAAARNWGMGRILFFSTRVRDYLHEVYHPVFQGICLSTGDSFAFIANSLRWLGEPSLATGYPGGYIEPAAPPQPDPIPAEELAGLDIYGQLERTGHIAIDRTNSPLPVAVPRDLTKQDFVGLAGVVTSLSAAGEGVTATVADYCTAARQVGLHFLIFGERFENMTPTKFSDLVAACQAQSTATFSAIPGFDIKDYNGDRRLLVAPPSWPAASWLSADGLSVKGNHSALYFGYNWQPYFLLRPAVALMKPWEAKFYTGLSIFSYTNGSNQVESALDAYLNVQGRDYNLVPFVAHGLRSPSEIPSAMAKVLLHVRSATLQDVVKNLKYSGYSERPVYVSSGPKLVTWTMKNARLQAREERWYAQLAIDSAKNLRSVTIYNGNQIYQHYLPGTRTFETTLTGCHDKQRYLTTVAEDIDGGIMISSTLCMSELQKHVTMCTDLQNTLSACVGLTIDQEYASYGGLGIANVAWDDYQIRNTFPDEEMRPRTGIEIGYGGWKLASSPRVDKGMIASREFPFDAGDICMTRDVFNRILVSSDAAPVDSVDFKADVLHYGWTPKIYTTNIHGIIQTATALRNRTAKSNPQGPSLVMAQINFGSGLFPNYVLVKANGEKTVAPRPTTGDLTVTVEKGGYLAFLPDVWGAVAVFPMDQNYRVVMKPTFANVELPLASLNITAGQIFNAHLLFCTGRFGGKDETEFDFLRAAYGFAGTLGYQSTVLHGSLVSTLYELELRTTDNYVELQTTKSALGTDLPIVVEGLNEKWDSGLFDISKGKLQRIATYDSKGWCLLDVDTSDRRVRIGNLLTCDDPDVQLSLIETSSGWQIAAHNPKDQSVSITIRVAPWLGSLVSAQAVTTTINAGSTKVITL